MTNKEKYYKFIINFSFVVILFLGIINTINGDDFFWHVKIGEWIVDNKQIPKTGIFSWFAKDSNWFAHEWLSEILMYLCSLISIKYAAHIFLTICILILGIILSYINRNRFYKSPILLIIWEILGFCTITTFSTARPHWITLFLLVIYICILEEIKKNTYKHIWIIPIIAIIWSNVHGGSSNLLYLLPIGFLLTGINNWKIGKLSSHKMNKKQLCIYLITIITNILCICINPRGIELLKYPYSYKEMNLEYITEWLPLSYGNLKLAFIVIIGIIILLCISKKQEIELSEFGLIFLFIIMSFIHLRFVLWTYVISSIYIFKYFNEFKHKDNIKKENTILFFNIFCTLASIIIILSPFFVKNINVSKPIPNELIEIIKEDTPDRLYNDYNYGGYLIYNDIPVFIDGRADMYEWIGSFEENMKIQSFSLDYESNIDEYIKKYEFDAILTSKNNYINLVVRNLKNFNVIYENEKIIYYEIIK